MKYLQSIVGVALLSVACMASASVYSEKTEQFSVGADVNVVISNVNGDVTINTWDQNEVKVNAKLTADSDAAAERVDIEMTQDGNVITVRTHYKKSNYFSKGDSSEVAYEIWVPNYAALKDVSLVNGNLSIKNQVNSVQGKLVNGDVISNSLAKQVKLTTVNGEMKIGFADAKTIDSISLKTVNGLISLAIPEDSDISLDVDSTHGNIRNEFGLPVHKRRYVGSELKGMLGNGAATATISTVNGEVEVIRYSQK